MIKHPDGAVTLTAEEFAACAAFCELSPSQFEELLQDKAGVVTTADLVAYVLQRAALINFEPENPSSTN